MNCMRDAGIFLIVLLNVNKLILIKVHSQDPTHRNCIPARDGWSVLLQLLHLVAAELELHRIAASWARARPPNCVWQQSRRHCRWQVYCNEHDDVCFGNEGGERASERASCGGRRRGRLTVGGVTIVFVGFDGCFVVWTRAPLGLNRFTVSPGY